jgi:hypothetical protein
LGTKEAIRAEFLHIFHVSGWRVAGESNPSR